MRGASMERSKAGTNSLLNGPNGLSQPNQNTILINLILEYFTGYRKSTMNFN